MDNTGNTEAKSIIEPSGEAHTKLLMYAMNVNWPNEKLTKATTYLSDLLTSSRLVERPDDFSKAEDAVIRSIAIYYPADNSLE